MTSSIATILFTDVVDSTALLQRLGDERARSVFERHHRMLRDALASSGGEELQWLGDGQMAAFASPADAVRCAIAMQQGAARPIDGERLRVRVGLNVGEIMRDPGGGYFGTPVVTARRLCDAAQAGEILCTSTVAGVLAGRRAFRFRARGPQALKGLTDPVGVAEVEYEAEEPTAFLATTPFVGRDAEMARLGACLRRTQAGAGALVMVVGEPGIGKTRTAEELAELARRGGARVLAGRCYEGEWAPPYGPFVEAIEAYAGAVTPDELRRDLGPGAPPLARLVPSLRERLPDIAEPIPLQADEERFRLLDAVSQLLIEASERAPVVLVLDDLHWADRDTIAMLRHVARAVSQHRLLVVGLYRDVELDRQHPLADALGALRREAPYERIALKGLDAAGVEALLEGVAQQEVNNPALVRAISEETNGNPFFIREVLIHLVEEGKLYREGGRWTSRVASVAELGIPEGVRQVITRRLSRLSETANKLLAAASAFEGAFRFDVAAGAAGLDETVALDAVDEALGAQLLRATGEVDSYDFTHALIRHTLYAELNPSRQVRLHRRIAEALAEGSPDRAADIAYHYHRSAAMSGAEAGVAPALAAAEAAEAAYAHDDAATFLRMALDLMPAGDVRRPRLLARLGLALIWALRFEQAAQAASEAGAAIAHAEGDAAAADCLAEAAQGMSDAGYWRGAWALAAQGLRYAGERRDATWVSLKSVDILRAEAEEPDYPGHFLDTPERREVGRVVARLPRIGDDDLRFASCEYFASRAEVLAKVPDSHWIFYAGGDFRASLRLFTKRAAETERQGRLAAAIIPWANIARCHNALGDFAAARAAYERAAALASRLPGPLPPLLFVLGARFEMCAALDEGLEEAAVAVAELMSSGAIDNRWAEAPFRAGAALIAARLGRVDDALGLLGTLPPALERGWIVGNYTTIACTGAETLWLVERTDHLATIERAVRQNVVEPDFRYPNVDGRLALARLCALCGRWDEAAEWFARARTVLEEQGARPLRAITDFDEALMYQRRGALGDRERARALLDRARTQFEDIGMSGWLRRTAQLATTLEARS
jgi:class 3 adenylate cyclase/tetratricopeptide (TPR) repeat protein